MKSIPASKLREVAYAIRKDGANEETRLVSMFANDERQLDGNFAIYCLFKVGQELELIRATIGADEKPEFPSLTPELSSAGWYEREIYELYGLKPVGHGDLRPLILHENWPRHLYPMRKDFDVRTEVPMLPDQVAMCGVEGEGVFQTVVGPIHAGIIEPGHFRFSQAGESILRLDARLGWVSRGIEKAVEGKPLEKAFYQVERISGVCSVAHSLAYCHAVESLAGVKVPARAQYLRALVAELERLWNHVGNIGNMCAGMGFAVGVMAGARLREWCMRMNEALTGNRLLRGMVEPGGVRQDITPQLSHAILSLLDRLMPDFEEMLALFDNDEFANRVVSTGTVPRQWALDLGIVGVGARASGVDMDSRRDMPYGVYPELQFDVPVYTSGDADARLRVRTDEVRETVGLIRQILQQMPPEGDLRVAIPAIKPYSAGFGWAESEQGEAVHWLMVGENNTIYRLHARAAAYTLWPACAAAGPGNIIPDFPMINKSFELSYACVDR